MSIQITRDPTATMRHWVRVGEHTIAADLAPAEGGGGLGVDPHDLYDAALGACKALTVLWYAKRKGMAIDELEVSVDRDASAERAGTYRLHTTLRLSGELSEAQRRELLSVAQKCPVHKLMTAVTTEITTELAEAAPATPP